MNLIGNLEPIFPRDAQRDAFLIEASSQACLMLLPFAGKGSEKPLLYENERAAKNAVKPNYCCATSRCAFRGRREIKERKAVIDSQLEEIRSKMWRAYEQCNNEFRKKERYCKEQREVLRALEDLEAKERAMYELDYRKDQVMTVCKIAMANLAMWMRDHYFPASYAHATWHRLVPFFRLSGTVISEATTARVQLRPFNDRALNRDLTSLCERVNEAAPRLPDGRHLCFTLDLHCRSFPALDLRVT